MCRVSRTGHGATLARALPLALTLMAAATLATPRAAVACMGTPPPPFCGKSLVLAKAAPPVVVLPGGGTFNVPAAVVFSLVPFPPGSALCPAGPYTVTVSLTATCVPGPGGSGMVTVPMVPGINAITIPVTVGAGPPRICAIAGTASTTLADGMTLTAMGDTQVCIVEPAPDDPSEPRLDLSLLGGSEIARVHPGDQAVHLYRITNNDPDETFTGEITVSMVNSSRLPVLAGPMPAGTGGYAISDPFQGDNFPVALTGGLVDGCVPLFRDPTDPDPSTAKEPIVLLPDSFVDVPVYSRPWGMCADGSCGEAVVAVDGTYSDLTSGFACTGFVTVADTSQPPSYLWPDGGEVARFGPQAIDTLGAIGAPFPGEMVRLELETASVQAFFDGNPPAATPDIFLMNVTPELGRTQIQIVENPPAGATFEFLIAIDIGADPLMFETEMVQMELIAGAPTGFENLAPSGMGQVEVHDISGPFIVDSFFDVTYQISGQAIDDFLNRIELVFDKAAIMVRPDGSGFDVQLAGVVPEPPNPMSEIIAFDLFQDFRGFMSEIPTDTLIFADGFESGDVSAWSGSVP